MVQLTNGVITFARVASSLMSIAVLDCFLPDRLLDLLGMVVVVGSGVLVVTPKVVSWKL